MELRKVTEENLAAILRLSVRDDQKNFVADNSVSLGEAYIALSKGRAALPFGLYEANELVGFAMLGYDNYDSDDPPISKGSYCLWRFLIDQHYQGRGLGRLALEAVLRYVSTRPVGPSDTIWLSYEPENAVARSLYHKKGFRENGQMCGEEIVAVRSLEAQE